MGRIRTIKPEFWLNEDLAKLPPDSRLFAIAILNYADDEGYFNANLALIRGELFPFDDDSTTIRRSIDDLSSIDYLRIRTAADGRSYGFVVNFLKHQKIDRPKPSKIKSKYREISVIDDASTIDRRLIDDASLLEGKGKEQGTGNREWKRACEKKNQNGPIEADSVADRPETQKAAPDAAGAKSDGNVWAFERQPDTRPTPLVPIPDSLQTSPEFVSFWDKTWIPYLRDRNCRAPTQQTLQSQLAYLVPFGGAAAIGLLETAIRNTWGGPWPEKQNGAAPKKNAGQLAAEAIARRAARGEQKP